MIKEILVGNDLVMAEMKEMKEINFAELCKSLRHKRKWTQRQMAEVLGVSLRAYQYYEAEAQEPNAQAAFRLAQMVYEDELKGLPERISEEIRQHLANKVRQQEWMKIAEKLTEEMPQQRAQEISTKPNILYFCNNMLSRGQTNIWVKKEKD